MITTNIRYHHYLNLDEAYYEKGKIIIFKLKILSLRIVLIECRDSIDSN